MATGTWLTHFLGLLPLEQAHCFLLPFTVTSLPEGMSSARFVPADYEPPTLGQPLPPLPYCTGRLSAGRVPYTAGRCMQLVLRGCLPRDSAYFRRLCCAGFEHLSFQH
jgi:hypothetical protein